MFCGFGKWLDDALDQIGGKRILEVGLGDELTDREKVFTEWSRNLLKESIALSGIGSEESDHKGEEGDVQTRWRKSSTVVPIRESVKLLSPEERKYFVVLKLPKRCKPFQSNLGKCWRNKVFSIWLSYKTNMDSSKSPNSTKVEFIRCK